VSNNPGIESIFASAAIDTDRLKAVESLGEPRSKYMIAITPRSGSSWLCDAMKKTHRFGTPDEALSAQHIPHIIKRIPGYTPEAYFRNVIRSWSSRNGVSGLKTSWFQFRNFSEAMKDHSYLAGFRWVYLTRRDLAAQAVSLYKAVETSVFHTNVNHDLSALEKLAALDYRYEQIAEWYEHIAEQERGWQEYFYRHRIFPLCLSYEDIDQNLAGAMQRLATFVGVNPDNVSLPDVPLAFRKISDDRNGAWAQRFVLERSQRERAVAAERTPGQLAGVSGLSSVREAG
jgi:LPS sulfotransferase NodH